MAIDTTPLARASTWHTLVYGPLPNSTILSADIKVDLERLGNSDQYLYDTKLFLTGGTMTGRLIVGTSTAGQNGIETTGNTTGAGITGTGGNAGSGGIFTAGGGNKYGVEGFGSGTATGVYGQGGATGSGADLRAGGGNAAGVQCLGSGTGAGASCVGGATGPGLTAVSGTAQTNTAPTCAAQFAGYIQLTGTDPNTTVDPGGNNVLHAMMIPKAMVLINTSYAVVDSYNVASIANVAGDIYRMTFVRPMATVNYGVKVHVLGAPGYSGTQANATKATTHFDFVLFKTDTLALGFGAATEAYIEVTGRQ